ncbi:MAG: MATE family efflux transporter [Oscillospiraceae bacterium]|nr:MATE family efflux transporter [Oscillospiraceae bacterium]
MRKHGLFEVNMLEGSLSKNILLFALPLMATNILQFIYSAADMIVLGKFSGTHALAAVGATGSTYNIIINVFIGLATGVAVVVAQQIGADDRKGLSDTVHTAGTVSVIIGIFVCILGLFLSPIILKAVGTPADIFDDAVLYLRVMFAGIPALVVYNFGASILRSVGDSRRPFYYLAFSGALNVVLNLFFVLGFDMSVDGVALATIISQYASAVLVWVHLMRTGECYYFHIKEARIVKKQLWDIIRIGVPTGLQSALFSLSNLLIQSAINSFGTNYIAASTTANNIENICYTTMAAMGQAVLVFCGQNVGAGNIKRLKNIYLESLAVTLGVGVIISGVCMLFDRSLLGLFTNDAAVVEIGLKRLAVIVPFYFICGFYECGSGACRGTGYALFPMIGALFGICFFRVIWLYTAFSWSPTFETLVSVYPVSWAITFVILSVMFAVFYHLLGKRQAQN